MRVQGITNGSTVVAGGYHSMVLGRDGIVKAWGWNAYGQLGTGGTVDQLTPVTVTAVPAGTAVYGIGSGALLGLAF